MDTVYLWNDERNGWQADFRDSSSRWLILGLFGTTAIPTGYTSQATFERVVSGLKENPKNSDTRFVYENRG
jgi:hypothetical protein